MTQKKLKAKSLNNNNHDIAVIGAGSWGTALALLLSQKGNTVWLWGHSPEHVRSLLRDRENKRYLPDFLFPENIRPTKDIEQAVGGSRVICMVVPSHVYRTVFTDVIQELKKSSTIISATKGVENQTLMTMSQVMKEVIDGCPKTKDIHLAVLSGPSFAKEVADNVPTAVTIGCFDIGVARNLQDLFNSHHFRVYASKDVIGLEISAALKNIIAIAAGICDGLRFGSNARAALITRGLAEITKLGVHLGADQHTFSGLSGLGDLVLTCTGDLSRNRSVGIQLGEGKKIDQILAEMSMVAEGVKTTKSVHDLANNIGIEMPILEQVYKILYENKDCRTAVNDLMSRDPKME